MSRDETAPVRILRVIARLNVGGPAIQAITLSRLLDDRGYETRLVRGQEGPREGSMDALAEELGVTPVRLPTLQRKIGLGDVAALLFLRRQIRDWRPQILHTHAAKAGALGRLAALLAGRSRPPLIVHTFHGHVLTGYFSAPVSAVFRWIERWLARRTTCLIAVSEEIRDDLVRLRVAPPERIAVVPLGFDLARFAASDEDRRARRKTFREDLGIPLNAPLVTLVARLEPIKRVDRFLRVANLVEEPEGTHFLVVGDGVLREELLAAPEAAKLGNRLVWGGMRDDMPDVYFASDILAVTSDNEGTAVSAIEAHATGLPVVSTRVGGMPSVVRNAQTGLLVSPEDEGGFAAALQTLLLDKAFAQRLGTKAVEHVHERFSLECLVLRIEALYEGLTSRRLARGSLVRRQSPPSANRDARQRAPNRAVERTPAQPVDTSHRTPCPPQSDEAQERKRQDPSVEQRARL
jgi:glycosyltransferase involved in cell wall biosynthesis